MLLSGMKLAKGGVAKNKYMSAYRSFLELKSGQASNKTAVGGLS